MGEKRINDLAGHDDIGHSEEDVKINFVVPLLEAFGHNRMIFEYQKNDIILKKGLHERCAILVETKRYGKPLNSELEQLKRHWDAQRCLLAIISNGKDIWVFSPFWTGKRFEDTIIMNINRNQLIDEEIRKKLFTIMSKETLTSGEALENVKKMEDEIEDSEEKKRELEKQKANISEKLSQIDKQIEEMAKKIPRTTTEGFITSVLQPSGVVVGGDYSVADTSTYDLVNYWGLALGKQIMVCKNKRGKSKWFLWYKKGRTSRYKLSPEGEEFLRGLQDPHDSSYIADVEYLSVPGSNLDFWKRLYDEKVFPYWDPEGGPFLFMKDVSPNNQYIVICRVYKINVTIEEKDVNRSRSGANIKNDKKLDGIRNATKTPVLLDDEFDRVRVKIKEIIDEFR